MLRTVARIRSTVDKATGPSSLVGRLAVADHQASELPAAGFTGLYSE